MSIFNSGLRHHQYFQGLRCCSPVLNTYPPSDAQRIEKETEIDHSPKNIEETDAKENIELVAPLRSPGKKSKKSTSIKKRSTRPPNPIVYLW